MNTKYIIMRVILGTALLVVIAIDINFNWLCRGKLAFGGENLLHLIAIGWYIKSWRKYERVH